VEAKLDPGSADRILQVQQAQPDPGGQAIADAFLLAPPTHRIRVRVSERKADLDPLLGLGGKQLGDLWIAVRQEQPGKDEHVDASPAASRRRATAPLGRRHGWGRG
jgi:hypothetical protein